ncbi:MAG: SH3 domain-containing protein [Bacteroidota bacterium]|nr:SH3 domain-containing protein [Bacteroidota bacterium]
MKRILFAVVVLLFSIQVALAQKTMYVSSGNGINLREGPGPNKNIVSSIPKGSKLKVLSIDGDWAKVEYDGKTGYVSRQNLSEEKPKSSAPAKSNTTGQTNNNSSTRNSGNSSTSSSDRKWGIGLRGGNPAGITVKKYNANKAWEFNVGHTYYWNQYGYRDAFYNYGPYAKYRNVEIKDWHRGRALAFQVHHLWHKDLNAEGLQWYYGLGGQLKSISISYRYKYEDQAGIRYDNVYSTANFINLGVDGIIGLEYTFK